MNTYHANQCFYLYHTTTGSKTNTVVSENGNEEYGEIYFMCNNINLCNVIKLNMFHARFDI